MFYLFFKDQAHLALRALSGSERRQRMTSLHILHILRSKRMTNFRTSSCNSQSKPRSRSRRRRSGVRTLLTVTNHSHNATLSMTGLSISVNVVITCNWGCSCLLGKIFKRNEDPVQQPPAKKSRGKKEKGMQLCGSI